MQRFNFQRNGLNLSYLDSGSNGQALIALHSHWMQSQTFAPLAEVLAPEWRVIALDQRGHGESDHALTYSHNDYIDDLLGLTDHLGPGKAVLLGNSLGGVNAYQFAARYPDRARALIIEDIGAVLADDTSFAFAWSGIFKTRGDLGERIGPRFLPYIHDSIRTAPAGWRLAFDLRELAASQEAVNGNHWQDWLATDCPALLLRGQQSRVTTQQHMEEMAATRPHTLLRNLEGGHVLHFDNPAGFASVVSEFLVNLP
ncbi:MAG: alpha/beta hydrolase [Terracidiphilus sp.]|jgi:pimeloyl-ACP methyl ester carboxylesterase